MSKSEQSVQGSFTRNQLRSLQEEGMKSIFFRDAAGRIQTLYEAHITAETGDLCLRTDMKYSDGAGGTSRRIVAMQETLVPWPGYVVTLAAPDAEDFTQIP